MPLTDKLFVEFSKCQFKYFLKVGEFWEKIKEGIEIDNVALCGFKLVFKSN